MSTNTPERELPSETVTTFVFTWSFLLLVLTLLLMWRESSSVLTVICVSLSWILSGTWGIAKGQQIERSQKLTSQP